MYDPDYSLSERLVYLEDKVAELEQKVADLEEQVEESNSEELRAKSMRDFLGEE